MAAVAPGLRRPAESEAGVFLCTAFWLDSRILFPRLLQLLSWCGFSGTSAGSFAGAKVHSFWAPECLGEALPRRKARIRGPLFGHARAQPAAARLDRQQSARFLSYSGFILEFWQRNLAAEARAASCGP
jgi:hypothetical protein